MLDEQLKQQTLEFLKLLESPVQFTLSVGEDENSKKVEQFVKEICSLDEKNLSYTYESWSLLQLSVSIRKVNNQVVSHLQVYH